MQGGRGWSKYADRTKSYFLLFLLAIFEFYLVGVGAIDDPLLSRGEHRSPAKKHKVTFLSEFFSLVRKERKGQKEECFPLLNTFCRFAATGANKVPRPSNCSVATATGSKRSSADSDSLLCHVGLWRTSRFEFGCASWCEHSKIGLILNSSVIALTIFTPAMHFQRACRQCVHESARFSRVICSHARYG